MPPAVPSKSKSDGTPMEHPPFLWNTNTSAQVHCDTMKVNWFLNKHTVSGIVGNSEMKIVFLLLNGGTFHKRKINLGY